MKKQQRSDYVHIDSWEDVLETHPLPVTGTVGISGQPIETIAYPGMVYPVTYGDSASIDAFARLRVSNPTTLFDSQDRYDSGRVEWETSITNTSGNAAATHSTNKSEVAAYVEASDVIIRQTRRYFRYQPGKSQLIFITFVMDSPNAQCTQRVGYFDAQNGIFFENSGTGYNMVRRSYTTGSAVDTQIPQASWNIDTMDGSGVSGYTLDFTKAQIFFMDIEWLGAGRVRTGFIIDGIPYYVHEFLHANIVSSVYMSTPNLPVRYEIRGTASLASGKTLHCICSSVISEGGFQIATGLQFSVDNENVTRTVTSGSYVPIIAIRPKLTFGGITNRGRAILEAFSVYSDTISAHYDLIYGGTLVGGAWVSASDDSIVEYNVTATGISGGIDVNGSYVSASNQTRGLVDHNASADYPLFLNIAGAHPVSPYSDTWVLAVISLGNNTQCAASIDWVELR